MRPQQQLLKHDPANGVYGDCFRTCVAAMLDLSAEDVPHVFDRHYDDGDAAFAAMNAWLAERGHRLIWSAYEEGVDFDRMVTTISTMNPGLPFMVGGQSSPGTGHFIVCMDAKVACDPSLSPTGTLTAHDDGLWHVYFIGSKLSAAA